MTYKTFKFYWSILGFRKGKVQKYSTIPYAFIQSARVKQIFHSVSGSNTFIKQVYNGYIKFSEDVKIPVIQAIDKEAVIRQLQVIAMDLNLEIIDFTDQDSISIFPGSLDELSG